MYNYVDIVATLQCTAMVWSGERSMENIILIDPALLEWMQGY